MGRDRSRSMSSTSSGRGMHSATWDGESGYRVHVSDLAVGVSRKEIERAFTKYGDINEVWVATNPPCFAFVNFKHRSDAEKSVREMNGKLMGSTRVGVSWARNRRYGGRNGGGRSAPYGSYRSGRGTRRRSRSRSRSDSRHQRRRNSRSRSRDRHRRRSPSPRDRKQSTRKTNETDAKDDDHKNDRQRIRASHSVSRSRSRSNSRTKSSNEKRKRSPSRSPSNEGDNIDAPIMAKPDENNTYDESPLAANDDEDDE